MSAWSGTSVLGVTASSAELEAVQRQLTPGERIEWIGRPDPRIRLKENDAQQVLGGLILFGIGIWWEIHAMQAPHGGWIVGVFGLITFMALAGYMAVGRIVYRSFRRRRTTYAVTDRRVMSIVRHSGGDATEARSLDSFPFVRPDARADGKGGIGFGLTTRRLAFRQNQLKRFAPEPPGFAFYDIDDAERVAALIKRLQAEERTE